VWTQYLPASGFDIDKFDLSGPEYLDYAESTQALESMGAFMRGSRSLTGETMDAERISVGFLSSSMLPTLGVAALLGRGFSPEEDVPDGPEVAVLGYYLWQTRFGADPSLLGKSIVMNGVSTEVIGVMPEGFAFPADTRAWLPLRLDRGNEGGRGTHG